MQHKETQGFVSLCEPPLRTARLEIEKNGAL